MNWGKGFFRLWLFASIMWIAAVSYTGYSRWSDLNTAWGNDPLVSAPGKNKTDEFGGVAVDGPWNDFTTSQIRPTPAFVWWHYLVMAIGIPALIYGIALSLRWIAAGFRHKSSDVVD